ncbi:L-rhamnose mutarotase [Streptomyces celluloflavus]|uniref:L-rhamnose mutarotase n=2 Tax=Streptomyces TaxID=1883 RepID=A0A4Q9HW22_STRKA|nr:L-rhamnose mutarotase [Streptomyces kasugaensis]TBO59386.1 L-rhamnose mutarotase [Streptomyces kasugaensis]WSK15812.1 L-rhamnose mutarotase [Streptomyces celluloflavus]
MKNHAFTIRLRDQAAADKYIALHREVWPEIVGPGGALDTIGVRKLQIFFIEPLTLFMYVEAEDHFEPVRDFLRANDLDPRVQEWDDMMHDGGGSLLVRHPGNDGRLNWAPMQRVHHVDFTDTLPDLEDK